MSVNEKCKMYKETQSSIKKLVEKDVKLDRNVYMNQIVLIKKDVCSNDENVKKMALEMLNFLLQLNVEEIEVELIKTLHDNTVNRFMKNVILKFVKQKVVDAISKNQYDFTNILSPWKNQNINQLTNIIEDVCINDLPKDKCKIFFINIIIPNMLALSTDNQIRDALTDIAFVMSTILPISDLNVDELESFLLDVNTKYIINVGELRDKDYPNWHNLWIFLVRFCDKHIHYSMDLTNRLLRVVEFAFRNSSIQQRLRGYDCWKELIDNASLDMNHMCSAKQIKLLITPLKAKFSKQEVVICKRFDVFTYLLEKLQHKAVLCLTEFLEFCFGPVGDNKDASKTGQGKSVPQLWTKSTKVLIEIIGHSHGKTVTCLCTDAVINLENPVINYSNIGNFYKVIINSVGECCSLLKEIDIESKRDMVIKCMWKSVFDLVIPVSESSRKKYFEVVSEVLDNYIVQSRENPYFEDLLNLIFSVLMSYEEEYVYETVQYILKQLLTILFTVDDFPVNVADKFKAVVTHWFSKIFMVEIKLNVLKEILSVFMKLKPVKENSNHVGKIWLCLANELIIDLTVEQIENFSEFNDFFLWPAHNLQHLEDITKKQTVLHWMKLYRKITTDENKKLAVMKELEKVFKVNPLLNPNVVSLLNVMSQFETRFTKEFVNKIMIVSSQILKLPNLKTEEEQKITALVMQYFEPTLECFQGNNCDEIIANICVCIEHILCIHKGFKLLDTLTTFMRNSPPNMRAKFSKHLSTLLLDLFNKETDSNSFNAKELQKALQVLKVDGAKKEELTSPFVPPTGRSARIANMAKNSPRSPHRKGKKIESSPIALRLFGKDIDTLSPLPVKGSQLNKATPKSKKTVNTPKTTTPRHTLSVEDEKSSDFVPIDTQVKFQPEKLSRHQKEVLRKRREDIPALYQDLSQSQDMFSSSSSSKGFEKTDNETSGDKRKVIVEVIEEQFKPDVPKENKTKLLFPAPPETPVDIPVCDINVPNLFPDVALSSEMIPEAPLQTMEDLNIPNTDLNFEANLFPDAMLPSEIIPDEVIQAIKEVTVTETEANSEKNEYPPLGSDNVFNPDQIVIGRENLATSDKDDKEVAGQEPKSADNQAYQVEVVVDEKESAKSEAEEKERRTRENIELELERLRMDIVGAEEYLAASRRTKTEINPERNSHPSVDTDNVNPDQVLIENEKQATSGNYHEEVEAGQKPKASAENRLYQVEVVVEEKKSAKSRAEEKERRRRQKIELELQKLRMDIVGAEDYLAASRRTRTREKPKKLEDDSIKKMKTVTSEEKVPPSRQQLLSKSLNAESFESRESKIGKSRRKSVESIQDVKSDAEGITNINLIEHKKDPDTPRSRTKRSWKFKLDDDNKGTFTVTDAVEKTPKSRGRPRKVFNKDEATENSGGEKVEKKRKHSSGDEESEDIIESSQQFHADVTPVFNSSKRRSLIDDISHGEEVLNKLDEKTLVQQKTLTIDLVPDVEHNLNEMVNRGEPESIEDITKSGEAILHEAAAENVADKQMEGERDKTEEIPAEINASQDTTVTQESSQDVTCMDDDDIEELLSRTADTQTQHTQDTNTQDTLTQSQFSAVSDNILPLVPFFDLPKKPELTESERLMCRMDTMSICMDSRSSKTYSGVLEIKSGPPAGDQKLSLDLEDVLSTPPSTESNSIPSSPITVDTPTRTSELLNNTLDISPINSKSSSDDGEPEDNRVISIDFKADMEELNKMEKEDILQAIQGKTSQEAQKNNDQENRVVNSDENGDMPVLVGDILSHLEEVSHESAHQGEYVPVKIEEVLCESEQNMEQVDVVSSKEDQGNENILVEIEHTPIKTEEPENLPDSTCQDGQMSPKKPDMPDLGLQDVPDSTRQDGQTSPKKPDMPDLGFSKTMQDTSIQERASRLLSMVNLNSPMIAKMYTKGRIAAMSPSTARVKKLMSGFNQKPRFNESYVEVKEEDLLTFTRDIPSPLAVPRSSILKRKASDSSESDGISPCPKRKRVNFSDPCLTSKKLFIKDDYNRDTDTTTLSDESLESSSEEEKSPKTTDLPDEPSTSEKFTETENFETEPTLEIVNPLMLKKDRPIYPKLVDCKESVLLILKRVTSPMFITTLMNKLKSKEIKTIGDLAKQSEAEINRFPFKVPVVPNVYKALDNYYKKNVDKLARDGSEGSKVNGLEESRRHGVIRKASAKKVDVKVELKQLMEKSKLEGTFEDLLRLLLSSVEKQQLLNLAKIHYSLELNDFLPETDFKLAMKHMTQKVGLPNVLEMLTGNFENSEEESVYFDCITKQSLDRRSLSDIWENRSLDDIRIGLEDSINRNVFSREEVMDRCIVPLIENPENISSYVARISVVQLSDIIIRRVQGTDMPEFFRRILDSCSEESSAALSKEALIRIKSPREVVNVFEDCLNTHNEEAQAEIMVEMFKYISGKLSFNTLLELHVGFLKRIPSLMPGGEK